MQLDVNVDWGLEGCGYPLMSYVGSCSLCPPPVSQVLKLLGEERTVRRQVSCGKILQKESALASAMLRKPVALESSAGCAGKQRR